MQLRHLLGSAEFFQKRKSGDAFQSRVATLDHIPKDGLTLHEFAAHGPPLRALSAHDESNPRRAFGPRSERCPNLHAIFFDRERVEFLDQLRNGARDEREAMRMVIAPVAERVGKIGQHRRIAVQIDAVGQPRSELYGVAPKRIFRASGKQDRPAAVEPHLWMVGVRKRRRRLRENDVRICAAESERVYARQAFAVCFREGLGVGRHS